MQCKERAKRGSHSLRAMSNFHTLPERAAQPELAHVRLNIRMVVLSKPHPFARICITPPAVPPPSPRGAPTRAHTKPL